MKNKNFFADISNYSGWLRSSHIARHLTIYELFKKTLNLPGSVAEFGVWRGSTFFLLARLIDIFDRSVHENLGMTNRLLFGFDTFEGFQSLSSHDLSESKHKEKKKGGLKFDTKIFYDAFEHLKSDMKFPDRIKIIKGDVKKTLKPFFSSNSGIRFNFINLDMDLYEPTKHVLNNLPKRMVKGGIIIFDEYGYEQWPGATKAADEFIKKHKLTLYKFEWSYGPGAYCIWTND